MVARGIRVGEIMEGQATTEEEATETKEVVSLVD